MIFYNDFKLPMLSTMQANASIHLRFDNTLNLCFGQWNVLECKYQGWYKSLSLYNGKFIWQLYYNIKSIYCFCSTSKFINQFRKRLRSHPLMLQQKSKLNSHSLYQFTFYMSVFILFLTPVQNSDFVVVNSLH